MAEFVIIGSQVVAHNLANADKLEGSPETGAEALTGHAGGVGETNHPDPTALGLNATAWVSLAMLIFLAIVVWKGGARAIAGALDRQIADVRRQLDEAKSLRAEAESLRDEYARKNAQAEQGARDMIAHAESEADQIVRQAEANAADLVERRGRMAEDKIAAAERTALAEVRAKAADAASKAAARLIETNLDATRDRALVDRTIAGLGRPN